MNRNKLRIAEEDFFSLYPGGFENEDLQAIRKKHQLDKRVAEAQQAFRPEAFSDVDQVVEDMTRLISRSSMVSLFEKPKFRDSVKVMDGLRRADLVSGLRDWLHADQQAGFERMLDVLVDSKLAKWSLMTILPNYYKPLHEVFVKPTTAKGVIKHFELSGLEYKPRPSWTFYQGYRDAIHRLRDEVDPSLASSNAAFCGFLMMSVR